MFQILWFLGSRWDNLCVAVKVSYDLGNLSALSCVFCAIIIYIFTICSGGLLMLVCLLFIFSFFIWQYDHLELKGEKRMARKFLQAIKFTNIYSSVGVISRYLRHKCPLSVFHVCLWCLFNFVVLNNFNSQSCFWKRFNTHRF